MMQKMLAMQPKYGHEVHEATCDQCQFGLQVQGKFARKRTHRATNAKIIAQRPDVLCQEEHEHHDLTGST